MMITERAGLRRFPVVTVVVFAATAAVNLLQFVVHDVLAGLERTPAGLHGDWWRSVTSLFVQDGGVAGTVSNLLFLLLMGTVAEQVLSRSRWLIQYFGVGVVCEFVGYAWQPTGGGNSIAICSLAGAVALTLWRDDSRLPDWATLVLLLWCGAMIGTLWSAASAPAIVACVAASALIRVGKERGIAVHRPTALAVPLVGAVLAVAQNIHGAALLLGCALALLVARDRQPISQTATGSHSIERSSVA
ncbi:rhomboid family intramembrane serine protease [Streptomyces olivoreticuli]|uniref:rhomboid family intramembrane serine protease n=1 Tax=Streptomyces olivoreticuli TaxID=68246 RepID=UPI002657B3F4|nr:rhomboid family intramembrane serine protease [Streptomyces olivoreticuli]WKK25543.1 rhomboid family intramembrane serine protease [Streptomyces olivoreticuli]